MPAHAVLTDMGTMLLPAEEGCSHAGRHAVIVSCADNLTWLSSLLERGWHVTVLEKCDSLTKDSLDDPSRVPTGARRIVLAPNVGREAHGYLWYIVHHWSRLPPTVLFLQGDSLQPRPGQSAHINLTAALQPNGTLDRFLRECWSFASLVPLPLVTAGFRMLGSVPMRTFCELWRSLDPEWLQTPAQTAREDLCPLWTSTVFASFVVSRRAIRWRPLRMYERWLRSFEDSGEARELYASERDWVASEARERLYALARQRLGMPMPTVQEGKPYRQVDDSQGHIVGNSHVYQHARNARFGATFFERAWTLIFGCASSIRGCAYTANATRRGHLARCPQMELQPRPHAALGAQAKAPNASSYNRASQIASAHDARGLRPVRVYSLVRGEVTAYGCRAMYQLTAPTAAQYR